MQRRFLQTISESRFGVGQVHHGFRVEKVEHVKELQLEAIRLRHERTGAQYLHVNRADSNNVFSVALKTAPLDSTGVPHILEHTVLCGSRQFPVRDPFFKMLNRSMATYMNAWTASDWTMYPFAAVNSKDLENLRRVYMDAVFHPNLSRADFQQEGWRLEHEIPTDPKSPIVFKGVVYNEMKGAFSDVGSLFCTRLQQHMHPNSTYAVVSGGDPKAITDLTHEQLMAFHRQNYHPSNARLFSYGQYPLDEHLKYVNQVFEEFEPVDPPRVKMLPDAFSKPKRIYESCPPDPMGDSQKQTKMCLAFMINDSSDVYETFVMRLASYLLMNGQASPMHKALLQSNIGSEYSPGAGYDDSTQMATFSIGLQGIKFDDVAKVEELTRQVFDSVSKSGFEQSRIEGALHQIELGIKHRTANFGMGLAQGIITNWIHDSDPVKSLHVNQNIERLRQEMSADPEFFKNRIKRYFIENQNQMIYVMSPSDDYNESLKTEETERLNRQTNSLTEEQRDEVYRSGLELLKLQDSKQDLSCLPKLQVEEVPKQNRVIPVEHLRQNKYPIQLRVSETNEITYVRALATFEDMPLHLRSALPLFTGALTSLGTKSKSAGEFDELVRLYTGGIGASAFLSTSYSDLCKIQQGILFSGNSLDKNSKHMYELLLESISHANLDNRKDLKTLILRSASNMMNSVAQNGHMFARKVAASTLSPSSYYSEIYGGLSQVEWMNKLAAEENLDGIVEQMKDISLFLTKNSKVRCALTVSNQKHVEHMENNFLSGLPFEALEGDVVFKREHFGSSKPEPASTWIKTPFATNFAAKCLRTVAYDHPDVVPLRLLASLMSHHFLHKEIREKNGAYGGGASYSAQDGMFSFYSYRDPNPKTTLDSFSSSVKWALSQQFSKEHLDEAKLTLFGQLDSPISASSEGMLFFQDRIPAEMRQKYRDAIFSTTPEDVSRVAGTYLFNEASIAVIAGEGTPTPSSDQWNVKELK